MILLDKPYVSDYLQKSLSQLRIPVVRTKALKDLKLDSDLNYISENEAVKRIRKNPNRMIYSNSENAINWISEKLSFSDIPERINWFKDKVRFRELIRPIYPEYYFSSLKMSNFTKMGKADLNYPLVLKPAVGFFSMGVYKLNEAKDWGSVQKRVKEEIARVGHLYPIEVFNSSKFILEACIPGREFAMDAYFNSDGEAVVLNIMEHYFSSESDVSDRLYSTSAVLIRRFISRFEELLNKIGELAELRNFPVHVEVRLTEAGEIIPIEVNPMRFGGWCTTADLAGMAFGMNPYEMLFKQERPDWDYLLRNKENRTFNMLVLENSTGVPGSEIKAFNSEKLLASFPNVMEFREIDFKTFPIFGFLFVETNANDSKALEAVLKSRLTEYLIQ